MKDYHKRPQLLKPWLEEFIRNGVDRMMMPAARSQAVS